MQGLFSQVIREIQTGLSRLEQAVQQPPVTSADVQPDVDFQPQTPPPASSTTPNVAPAASTTPYTGQRWEYKVVYVNFRGQISSEGEQVTIERGARRSSFVRSYLDRIGAQGWELSGVSPLGDTENSYFVFKRPATGEAKSSGSSTGSAASNPKKIQIEEIDDSSTML